MNSSDSRHEASAADIFPGDDPTARSHRAVDWARTPLGAVPTWSRTLSTVLPTVLASQMPVMVWWGPQLVQIYNDAFADLMGGKHPAAAGQSASACWSEVWDELGPLAERARSGEAVHAQELPLLLHRDGYDEETFWTFSYSPIDDGSGRVGGVLVIAVDVTAGVVRGRRLAVLRDIGALSSAGRSTDLVLGQIVKVFEDHPGKVAFVVARMESRRDGPLEVVTSLGVDPVAPGALPGDPSLLTEVYRTCEPQEEPTPPAGWPIPRTAGGGRVERALHLPIVDRTEDRSVGVLTVGLNPHRAFDDGHRGFLHLIGRQVSTAVTDARAIAREQERARHLIELDHLKNRFLQNVSHELRTPLTLIAGSHRSIAERGELADAVRRDVAVAERAAMRLSRLVEGLLDLARSDEGALEPAIAPTDIAALTTEIAAMFRPTLDRAGLELRLDVGEVPEAVRVDPEMWSRIVSNLLSNAYKFTRRGSVAVELTAAADEVQLVVSDTGIGMDPETVAHAFERFHRVAGASLRTAEGAGIGLALVHDLAVAHGGCVEVDSVPGRGTRLTVRVPLRSGPASGVDVEGALRDARALATEAASWVAPGEEDPVTVGVGEQAFGPDDDRETILIVEDNVDLRNQLASLLDSDGWRVVAVGDVPSALAVDVVPTLVLSDVLLPGADGIELVRVLRDEPATADIPIVLLTALAGSEPAAEGLRAGATDYLVKPFDPDELRARVRAHAELHRRRRDALRRADAEIEGLETALASNRQIGAAIGIAMARHGLTQTEAFQVLSRASQDQNRKLREVADDVVFTGEVPLGS